MGIRERGRAAAATHLFLDSCQIEEQTVTTDPDTGVISDESPSLIYSGPCRVKPIRGADVEVAGAELQIYMYELQIPYDANGVDVENVVTVTSSDGDLDGLELVVEEIPSAGTFTIFRRVVCRRRR